MKRFIAVGLCIFAFGVPYASAHTLMKDGAVAAVMHIDPNDNPGTDATSTVHFLFQGSVPDFTKCACHVSIRSASSTGGSTVFFAKVGDAALKITPQNITFDYRFPALDAYTITFMGDSPQPFSLVYPVNVLSASGSPDDDGDDDANSMHMSPGQHVLHYGIFAIAFIGLLYIMLKPEPKKEEKK